MKKPYIILQGKIFLPPLLLILFICSCSKDVIKPTSTLAKHENENAKLIADAKVFFESSLAKADSLKPEVKNQSIGQVQSKSVNWNSAYTANSSLGKMVMVPVSYNQNSTVFIGSARILLNSLTRLYVYTDQKGALRSEVVTRIPTEAYLKDTSKNKTFSGIISVKDWQGNFIKAFLFKNGQISNLGAPETAIVNNDKKSTLNIKTNNTICYTVENGQCLLMGGVFYGCTVSSIETYCFTLPQSKDPFGLPPTDYTGGGGSEGSNSNTENYYISVSDIANATYVDDGKQPIDPVKYINCFTDGKTASQYKLTLYVDQPLQGSNDQISMTSYSGEQYITPQGVLYNVGHAFVGFQKINTDGTSVTQVMGFYPGTHSLFPTGAIKDDGGHGYSISYTTNVSVSEFSSALNVLSNQNANVDYVLSNVNHNEFNCIDAALTWTLAGGITLPTSASRGVFKNSPGDYGQALRNVNGSNTTPGYAPVSHGACN